MSQNDQVSETIQKESICKNCSGKLQFAPGTNKLKCPYCGTENEIEASPEVFEELDFEKFVKEFEEKETTEEVATIKCQGCGRIVMLPRSEFERKLIQVVEKKQTPP